MKLLIAISLGCLVANCALQAGGPSRGYSSTQNYQNRGTDDPTMHFFQPLPNTNQRDQTSKTGKDPAVRQVTVAPTKKKAGSPNINVTNNAKDTQKLHVTSKYEKSAVARTNGDRTDYGKTLYQRVLRDPNVGRHVDPNRNARHPLPSAKRTRGAFADWP